MDEMKLKCDESSYDPGACTLKIFTTSKLGKRYVQYSSIKSAKRKAARYRPYSGMHRKASKRADGACDCIHARDVGARSAELHPAARKSSGGGHRNYRYLNESSTRFVQTLTAVEYIVELLIKTIYSIESTAISPDRYHRIGDIDRELPLPCNELAQRARQVPTSLDVKQQE
ncbi:hypothetical protein EVAR_68056_1 [Eumeta japonica]|uniref:Uncharacterized protein n=1 Tax=Eumeta variegata TaxID=151549 RepID=A0A4C1ZQL1_EUMVA|nr:hypothetical protein EVAR_68056_1 [Eumeta japonica]